MNSKRSSRFRAEYLEKQTKELLQQISLAFPGSGDKQRELSWDKQAILQTAVSQILHEVWETAEERAIYFSQNEEERRSSAFEREYFELSESLAAYLSARANNNPSI